MPKTNYQKIKHSKGLCIGMRCTNAHRSKSWFCSRCTGKRYREKYPVRYVYDSLKHNAKRRGKFFDLSFEDFISFLEKNPDYMKKKGRKVKSLQIDRINPALGYTISNIQAITLRENIHKYHNEEKFDFEEVEDSFNFESNPFQ